MGLKDSTVLPEGQWGCIQEEVAAELRSERRVGVHQGSGVDIPEGKEDTPDKRYSTGSGIEERKVFCC